MTAEATLGQRFKRMLAENLGLKLFSLIVSIALFTVVHGSEAGHRSLYVPVVAMLPPESSGQVLVSELPDRVKVTLSGSRSVVNSIHAVDPVQIDLTRAPRYYAFEPSLFDLPAGIDLKVTPPALSLAWEPREERKLPVRVQFSGAPDPALEVAGKAIVTPVRLLVKGPKTSIEAMQELPTDMVNLSGLGAGTHRLRVPLLAPPTQVSLGGPAQVTVELTLEPRREQRRLRRLTVAALSANGPATLRPQHVDVTVAAPERMLEELDPEHVVPVVEFPPGTPDGQAVSLPVKLRGVPDGVRVMSIEPPEVLVRVR
ncbi:MAG TPA: CdaR family protein [Polyangiaceae bacterium]|nr:CdaR family protein [Polyangiaceae bacterium]